MDEKKPLKARFGSFLLDEAEALLMNNGVAVEMPPRAFQVLCELVRRAGQLVTKDALLDAVWGHRHINEAALKNIVSQLRNSLGDDARESKLIQTVSRHGYRFIAEVNPGVAPSAASPAFSALTPPDSMDSGPLVGRKAALDQLQAILAATHAGRRQIVFIAGEAGIGKSTLVECLIKSAHIPLAYGQCIEHYGGAEPYMPILEALNGMCRADDGGEIVDLLRRVAPSWWHQLPWLLDDESKHAAVQELANTTQERMLREFGELIDRVTASRPLLLILEDLHWSDHATIQLLAYLSRRRTNSALLLVCTFRATDLILQDHPLGALRQELRLRTQCVDMELEYLSEADIGEILIKKMGAPAPESFVRHLHTQTMGLPLFVTAVLEELIKSGQLAWSGQAWKLPEPEIAVPSSIAAVIDGQLRRLTTEQQRLLGAASICGIDFLHLPLAEVLQLDATDVGSQLEHASATLSWLRCAGTKPMPNGQVAALFRYGHALYRKVLYERTSALQRVHWHRQWAQALQHAYPGSGSELAAELALHFERGDCPAEAAAQLALVASRAMACGAPQEALLAARHGLKLGAGLIGLDLELELRVLEAVALTRQFTITDPEVIAAFERAKKLGAHGSPVWNRVLQGCWWIKFAQADYPGARELAREMLDQSDRDEIPVLRLTGLIAMGLVQMVTGQLSDARSHLETALKLYADVCNKLPATSFVQDPGAEAAEALALVYWLSGDPARARQNVTRAIELAKTNRHPISVATALYGAAILHALAGEFEEVHTLTEELYAVIRDHSLPERRSGFAWLHGQALVALGKTEEGLSEMRAAAQSAQDMGMRVGLCAFHLHYALACKSAGKPAEARATIDQGLKLVAEVGEEMMLPALLTLKAEDELEQGRVEEAQGVLQEAVTHARRQGAVFLEIQALALARQHRLNLCEEDRLPQLLALYADDCSPVIRAIGASLA
ncbi:MAG: AAA family ATPase [Burkholderiaceae bacterium]|nr:AAA family ATPase [Burkholderiaceae bacterium]